jgi:hypothetical protein
MASGRVPKTSSIFLMVRRPRDSGHCPRICREIPTACVFRHFSIKIPKLNS